MSERGVVRGVRVGARMRRGERGEAEAEQGGRHAHSKVVPAGLFVTTGWKRVAEFER